MAVSYTHLDVYKRQAINNTAQMLFEQQHLLFKTLQLIYDLINLEINSLRYEQQVLRKIFPEKLNLLFSGLGVNMGFKENSRTTPPFPLPHLHPHFFLKLSVVFYLTSD